MAHYNSMIEASLLMMASVAVPAVAAVLLTSFGLRITRRHFRHGTSASS
jgi:type III secretory pathway component EscT